MNKIIIFDLDGTLIDSRQDIANSLNFALAKVGLKTLPQSTIEKLVGWGAERLVQEAIGSARVELMQEVYPLFWSHYGENLLNETDLYPGAREFLEQTQAWPKAIVTNKPEGFTQTILAGLDLSHYFRWVIGADSLAYFKPDARVLTAIEKDFGQKSTGIMIGDSTVDLKFGRNIGFTTCILTHGFGQAEDFVQETPDYLVDDFAALQKLPIFNFP